jgi:uncharacterized protein YjiK
MTIPTPSAAIRPRHARKVICLFALYAITSVAPADDPKTPSPAAAPLDLAAFTERSKLQELEVPRIGEARRDTNFSGVAYNPVTRTLLVVDNEPNGEDTKDKPDQGDLYEFDVDGKFRRHLDLVGFSDPEGIAYMTADAERPDHDLFVISEERIGKLAVVSVPRGKETAQLTRGETGPVIDPTPNPIDDGNDQPNDGLEGVAYDAQADVFYLLKEGGPNRGVFRVARDGKCEPVEIPGLRDGIQDKSDPLRDLADVQFHQGNLIVLSEISNNLVAIRVDGLKGEITAQLPAIGQKPLPHNHPEGLTISDDAKTLWIIGEPREFTRHDTRSKMQNEK